MVDDEFLSAFSFSTPMTIKELADRFGVYPATATRWVTKLSSHGLLREVKKRTSSRGPVPRAWLLAITNESSYDE